MIRRTLVANLRDHIGQTVSVAGWVQALRLQRTVQFAVVRDHTGTVQVTHHRDDGLLEKTIEGLTTESAVRVTGRVVQNPAVALGGLEIVPEQVAVASLAETPLPVDERSGPEHRLDWRFLDVRRRPGAREVFAVQTTVENAMREFAFANGCTEMHTPKLMGTASESGAEVFRLGYFGKDAYLAQSPQFYKQMAIAAGIDRVFEVGPVFRAEPSFTSRHATEFTGVDVELAWIEDVEDVMDFEERMLVHVLAAAADRHGLDITIPAVPFPRITMAEAQRLLRAQGWDGPAADLNPEGERRLAAAIDHEFAFVTRYPAACQTR